MAVVLKKQTAMALMRLLETAAADSATHRQFGPLDLERMKEVWSFAVRIASPTAKVAAGTIRFGDASYAVAAGDVDLSGATEYVYVYEMKDHSARGLGHSTSDPLSSGDRWAWPLVECTAVAGVWYITKLLHRGDIFAYVPLR